MWFAFAFPVFIYLTVLYGVSIKTQVLRERSQTEKTDLAHDPISVRCPEEASLQRREADERWPGSWVWDR